MADLILPQPISCSTGDRLFGTGAACGKIILGGEHAVVYGADAVAMPVPEFCVRAAVGRDAEVIDSFARDLTVTDSGFFFRSTIDGTNEYPTAPLHIVAAVRKAVATVGQFEGAIDVAVAGNFPLARGLGASAACATAAARAVAQAHGHLLQADVLHAIVQAGEQVAHGRPSGVDARAVVAAGPIRFAAGTAHPIVCECPLWWVIADTGAAANTADAVERVRDNHRRARGRTRTLLNEIQVLVVSLAADLQRGDRQRVGAELSECHRLLAELGVSTPALDRLVAAAVGAGALGAKLTGGGLGGCMIALTEPNTEAHNRVRTALETAGAARTWSTRLGAAE
ncbi:mevalonate kinase [Nocardia brasiliensis]|uniref:mevalonate kinase n=2 Tax=Nocardia brasiliensis TaxID=37326 RepID=UPI002457F584|nr:mevalonate kinase [Nocardia brasiliensis]